MLCLSAGKASAAVPEKKMSAAEMRMKQLSEGKEGIAKPAASAFFSGRGDSHLLHS